MTREELIAKLLELSRWDDNETAHHQADTLLMEYINDPEIAAAYDEIHKWYA